MTGTIRMVRVYQQPRDLVWKALTDAELLSQWLMPTDMQPEVGHQFTFRTEPGPGFDGIVHCEVLELDPGHSMAWSWRGGPLDTTVRFQLKDVSSADGATGGTELTLVHTGFGGLKGRLVQAILRIGNRTLYGKKLPRLLAALAKDNQSTGGAGEDQACMSPWQRVLIFCTKLVPGRRAHPPQPPSDNDPKP